MVSFYQHQSDLNDRHVPQLIRDHLGTLFFNTIFVSSHNMYPENPKGTQVILGSMNMGYISDTARNRTHNLFRPKREPIPLGHSDGHSNGPSHGREHSLISDPFCSLCCLEFTPSAIALPHYTFSFKTKVKKNSHFPADSLMRISLFP